MPTYRVTAPDGRKVRLTGDSPPTEAELEEIFARLPQTVPQAAQGAPGDRVEPQGSAAGRFLGGVWENVNPVSIAKGLYGAVRHPVDTAAAAAGAMGQQWEQAYRTAAGAQRPADYVQAAGHAVAGTLPFIGPAAAAAGERIGEGDVAGGLGEGVGLLVPGLAPRGAQVAGRAVRGIAPKLEAAAAARVADVMSPKVGAKKARFGNVAERIAPALVKDLASDGAPLTRSAYHAQIRTKLTTAEQALDEAANARLPTKAFTARDILAGLEAKRGALTSKAVGRGKHVVPGPNAARVAVIDQAIKEIKQLRGPMVRYEPIRVMRQAYDGQAKVVYNPAVTADFLTAKGKALGAADVTAVLREQLAKWDPDTAVANAQYSLYRSADDVLSATAEVERVRPKVGRQIIARMTGTILGQQAGGVPGAVAGYVAGPILNSALASGVTTQLLTARKMAQLAEAIRKADVGRVYSLTHELKRLGVTAAAVSGRGATSPTDPSLFPAPAIR